jgi:hypothetical protein
MVPESVPAALVLLASLSFAQEPETPQEPEKDFLSALTAGDLEAYEDLSDLVLLPTEIGARRIGALDPEPSSVFHLAGFRFFPVARQDFLWDDNVLLAESNRRSSRVDITNLGLFTRGEFWGGRAQLDLGYLASINRPAISSDVYDDFTEQYGSSYGRVDGNGWYASGGYKIENRTQPVAIQFSGPQFAQAERTIRTGTARLGAFLGDHFLAEVGFDGGETAYDPGSLDYLDGEEIEVSGRLGWRADEDSLFYLRGTAGEGDFASDGTSELPDDDVVEVVAGVETQDVGRYELRAEVGYRHDEFHGTNTFGDTDDSHDDVVALVRGRLWLGETFPLLASYLRTIARATGSNFQVIDRGDLAIEPAFVDARLRARAGLSFESGRPSNQGNNTRFAAGIGGRFSLHRWFDLGADFEYRQRISDDPGGDYVDRRFTAGFAVRF